MAVELHRVMGGAPQLITIGADKTLAIWDTISFKVLHVFFIWLCDFDVASPKPGKIKVWQFNMCSVSFFPHSSSFCLI